MLPLHDYYAAIVYSMHPNNIEHVMVNGKLVVNYSNLVNVKKEEVINKFMNAYNTVKVRSHRLMKRVSKNE